MKNKANVCENKICEIISIVIQWSIDLLQKCFENNTTLKCLIMNKNYKKDVSQNNKRWYDEPGKVLSWLILLIIFSISYTNPIYYQMMWVLNICCKQTEEDELAGG